MREATADVFTSWLDAAAAYFAHAGVAGRRAREPILVAGAAATRAVREALS